MNRALFLFGDVIKYLESPNQQFDVCVASGILYHMTEPARFLELCSNVSDKLFIWSHYAEQEVVKTHPVLSHKIKRTENKSYRGFSYTEFHYEYEDAMGWAGFCGGANPFCRWITKEAIIEILKVNGYQHIHVFFDDLHNHPNGPHICLLAEK